MFRLLGSGYYCTPGKGVWDPYTPKERTIQILVDFEHACDSKSWSLTFDDRKLFVGFLIGTKKINVEKNQCPAIVQSKIASDAGWRTGLFSCDGSL